MPPAGGSVKRLLEEVVLDKDLAQLVAIYLILALLAVEND